MNTRKFKSSNRTIMYIIAVLVILAFLIWLDGGRSINGMMHRNSSIVVYHWNWAQILISLGIGFVLGILYSKRR